MKPEDLKFPHFDEGKIAIHDNILHIPSRSLNCKEFDFPGWSSMFDNTNPLNVEYCSGNGAWIVEKALFNPLENWIAVEKKFERVRKIWSKMKNKKLDNLFIVCADARITAKSFFSKESVKSVFVNFPDPWPKKRHAKHRLMQEEFIQDVLKSMKESAVFTLVTDDPDYSKQAICELLRFENFVSFYKEPYYIHNFEGYGSSYFQQLWKEKGRSIRYHMFQKKSI